MRLYILINNTMFRCKTQQIRQPSSGVKYPGKHFLFASSSSTLVSYHVPVQPRTNTTQPGILRFPINRICLADIFVVIPYVKTLRMLDQQYSQVIRNGKGYLIGQFSSSECVSCRPCITAAPKYLFKNTEQLLQLDLCTAVSCVRIVKS